MEARHGVLGRVWIADRGMASAPRIRRGCTSTQHYIERAESELKKFAAELARRARLAAGARRRRGQAGAPSSDRQDGNPVPLRRPARRRSMHDKFSRRIEQALERLWLRLAPRQETARRGESESTDRIHPPRNERAAARFTIVLEPDGCPAGFAPASPRSMIGPRSRTSCARTSAIRATNSSGRLHPAHPGRKPRFAFKRIG